MHKYCVVFIKTVSAVTADSCILTNCTVTCKVSDTFNKVQYCGIYVHVLLNTQDPSLSQAPNPGGGAAMPLPLIIHKHT